MPTILSATARASGKPEPLAFSAGEGGAGSPRREAGIPTRKGADACYLAEHLARVNRSGADLIFGNTPDTPFTPNMLQRRADQAWKEAKLERITPHVGRHSFAAMAIASGVNAKALSTFMGHSSIQITFDKYGALLPGSEEEAAERLDAYFAAQLEHAAAQTRRATGEFTSEQLANRD